MPEHEETLFTKVLSGVVLFGVAAGASYFVWNYEAPEKDPCQDLRDYFAEVHDTRKVELALGEAAQVVVFDTPDGEFSCGVRLEQP